MASVTGEICLLLEMRGRILMAHLLSSEVGMTGTIADHEGLKGVAPTHEARERRTLNLLSWLLRVETNGELPPFGTGS